MVRETWRSPAWVVAVLASSLLLFPIPPCCFFAVLLLAPLHVIPSSTCSAIRRTSLNPPCRNRLQLSLSLPPPCFPAQQRLA